MKLLTINTHSIIENDYKRKLDVFINAINEIKPDIITMQEVNQTSTEDAIMHNDARIFNDGTIPIKRDNHAYCVQKGLEKFGCYYNLAWLGFKNGYKKFDEGLSVMSLAPIEKIHSFTISKTSEYNDWQTRKVLGIYAFGEWFYSVHMGWWRGENEPFICQWERLNANIKKEQRVWLMGDFNNSEHKRGEGYDKIISDGWIDTYKIAKDKDTGYTAHTKIDGWQEKCEIPLRIDYIFTNKTIDIQSSFVVFDGKNREKISDHNAILVNL